MGSRSRDGTIEMQSARWYHSPPTRDHAEDSLHPPPPSLHPLDSHHPISKGVQRI